MISIKEGDLVIMQGRRTNLYLATVKKVWEEKSRYNNEPPTPAVLEIEYDSWFGTRKKLVKACYVEAVNRPVPQNANGDSKS